MMWEKYPLSFFQAYLYSELWLIFIIMMNNYAIFKGIP